MDVEGVLDVRGRAFWDVVQDRYEFDPHETEVLLEVCRTLDVIERLAAVVDRDGVMTVGSTGQPVVNGAVGELRQQQAAAARLLAQLNLDAVELGQVLTARQASARAAAQKRWRDQKRGQGA